MSHISRIATVALLATGLLVGCGKESASDATPQNSASTAPQPIGTAPNTEAVSRAAADFIDAVLKGDKDRAIARLTPKSVEKIVASGKHFGPPGEEGATFRMLPVHMRTTDQALVPFEVSKEPMCCVMKLVDGEWRVYGLAYRRGANQPWSSTDFETGLPLAFLGDANRAASQAQQASAASSRPSPPRTGQQPTAGTLR